MTVNTNINKSNMCLDPSSDLLRSDQVQIGQITIRKINNNSKMSKFVNLLPIFCLQKFRIFIFRTG